MKDRKFIGNAKFDDKDIMFDAFVEDLCDCGMYMMGDNNDAIAYIKNADGMQMPMYLKVSSNKRCVEIQTTQETRIFRLFEPVSEKLMHWNERESECEYTGIQFDFDCTFECKKIFIKAKRYE